MPEARAMNVAIFLDEVNEFNGPLMFIPGSHKQGVLPAGHDTSTTSYPLWTLDRDAIRTLVQNGGIVAPKGPAGSMISSTAAWCTPPTATCRRGIALPFT
jgi:ectoine hydroxylase